MLLVNSYDGENTILWPVKMLSISEVSHIFTAISLVGNVF